MSLQSPHDPFLVPDMEQAIERLHRAVNTHEPICFYGDYDVDGITATSLYLSFFGGLGAKVRAYVPHRLREGYGLNLGAVQRLAPNVVCNLLADRGERLPPPLVLRPAEPS